MNKAIRSVNGTTGEADSTHEHGRMAVVDGDGCKPAIIDEKRSMGDDPSFCFLGFRCIRKLIVSDDWFGCTSVGKVRNYAGDDLA